MSLYKWCKTQTAWKKMPEKYINGITHEYYTWTVKILVVYNLKHVLFSSLQWPHYFSGRNNGIFTFKPKLIICASLFVPQNTPISNQLD